MILIPSVAPPPTFSSAHRDDSRAPPSESRAPPSESRALPSESRAPPSESRAPPSAEAGPSTSQEQPRAPTPVVSHLRVPHVVLDTPTITHTMAATLAMSFLGHILFLKSQVPFPVMQLARMPGGQSDSRAAKRRMELLAAIDTLSSHMRTTFTALSTALALRKTGTGEAGPPSTGAAHLAFVLGPSVGAARARIVYAVDGLEIRVWGERDDLPGPSRHPRSGESGEGEDEDPGSEEGSEGGKEESEGDAEDPEASEDDAPEPPVSRSPSPSPTPPTSHSHASSPTRELAENIVPVAAPRRANTYPPTAPRIPPQTYAEEQQALRVAERLLSRTLANACAEESGGMSSELAPTQTHVLLRAPRRFAHPAWIPRQNLTRSLEGMLQSFLDDVCVRDDAAQARKSKGAKTEGVIVGCRREGVSEGVRLGGRGDAEDEDEEDEMIWWVWDGKIVGFADW